jgi:AbrB family looped-hinge helix DNA binding protein
MEKRATITSKGQVTIPVAIRKALGLKEGDNVVFEVDARQRDEPAPMVARIRPAPDLLALAAVAPPRRSRKAEPWTEVRRTVREDRARRFAPR